MASNYVNCMMQDRHGTFYIGMFGAFQTYDGENFRDIKILDLRGNTQPGYITCLLERRNGDILAGTSGHGLLKMTDKHTAKQMGGPLKNIQTVNRVMEDSHQRLWIATEHHGLICYDGKSTKTYFKQSDQDGIVLDICESKDGHIYIATAQAGLFRMDGEIPVHIDATGNKHISTLYVCKDGRIILGYDGMGMAIYDPHQNTLTDNPFYSRDVDLSSAKVYSICEDKNGNIWLGLLQKGIYVHPAKTTGFGYMGYKLGTRNQIGSASVTSVMRSRNGLNLVGTDKDGLY